MVDLHLNEVYLKISNKGMASIPVNMARMFGLALCIFNVLLSTSLYPWYNLIVFLSNELIILTIVQIVLSLYLTNFTLEKRNNLLAAYHMLTEINLGLHMCACITFWTLLRPIVFEEDKDEKMKLINTCCLHSFPQIAFLIDFMNSETKLVAWHGPYLMVPFTLAYGLVNYFFTIFVRQRNVYFFLPWMDSTV